jgi:O-acetyl-ADP-ribose deacetylase (regulator of RNase III)
MSTSFTEGDLLETEGLRAYAFAAQLDGTMDVGFASALKKRFPAFADAYATHCRDVGLAYGDVFAWTADGVTIYALGIQQAGQKPRLLALNEALTKLLALAREAKINRVGMVRIGTGPGGLDWTRVRKMLGEVGAKQPVKLIVFEKFVRARQADAVDTEAESVPNESE